MSNLTQQLSSCDCNSCAYNLAIEPKKYANNTDFSQYFECKNQFEFKKQIEPTNKSGYTYINPTNITKSYAQDFSEVDFDEASKNYKGKFFTSDDPRLISIMHNGQVLVLDRPPIDESIKLKDIYTDPRMKYYGQKYNDYSDINAGQILYYIDNNLEDTLFQPLFENPSEVIGTIYKDPMGATYPEYNRRPIIDNNVLKTKNRTYMYGLSSINDTNEFREDIIHKQMRVNDRQRYTPRYTGHIRY